MFCSLFELWMFARFLLFLQHFIRNEYSIYCYVFIMALIPVFYHIFNLFIICSLQNSDVSFAHLFICHIYISKLRTTNTCHLIRCSYIKKKLITMSAQISHLPFHLSKKLMVNNQHEFNHMCMEWLHFHHINWKLN